MAKDALLSLPLAKYMAHHPSASAEGEKAVLYTGWKHSFFHIAVNSLIDNVSTNLLLSKQFKLSGALWLLR
jgi:hypothetical protein